jgi:hypothetical protein
MAGKRYDIITPRPKNDGGTFWVRIGSAFMNDNGKIMLYFDALPLPDKEGVTKAVLSEPLPPRGQETPRQQNPQTTREVLDDDVPF